MVWSLMLLAFVSDGVPLFLVILPASSAVRLDFIASAPDSIVSHISTFSSDPDVFLNSVLGVD